MTTNKDINCKVFRSKFVFIKNNKVVPDVDLPNKVFHSELFNVKRQDKIKLSLVELFKIYLYME